jgi:hypothetical protein
MKGIKMNYNEHEKNEFWKLKSFEYNNKKLKNEKRILRLIFQRANKVRKKMGPEHAYIDMMTYIQGWLNKNQEWLSSSRIEHSKLVKERSYKSTGDITNEVE